MLLPAAFVEVGGHQLGGGTTLTPKSCKVISNRPKPMIIAIKAIILHKFGVPVVDLRKSAPSSLSGFEVGRNMSIGQVPFECPWRGKSQ